MALAVFAMAGFFGLPALIKWQVPKFAEQHLKRKASIGEVAFNPFTLRAEIRDFVLTEADRRPIAGFAALVADLDWSSITRRAWHFAEIRLTEPKATLDIAPDGRVNFAELVADLTRDAPKNEKAALPRMVIDVLVLERGRADLADRQAGYVNSLTLIDLRFDNLSTLPQDRGLYAFSAKTAKGGLVRWKGELSLNPIAVRGEVSGESLHLPELSAYLEPYTTAVLSDGKAGFVLPYRAAYQNGKFSAHVEGATFSIDSLALRTERTTEPFLALQSLRAAKLDADIAKRQISLGELVLDGGKALARRDARGGIDLLALIKAPPDAAGASLPVPAAPAQASPAWSLQVERFSLDNFALGFEDQNPSKPVSAAIGRLKLNARLEARTGNANTLAIHGLEIGVRDTQLRAGAKRPVRIGDISLDGGEFDLARRSLTLASVAVSDGQLNIMRNARGRIDLQDLLTPPAVPPGDAVATSAAAPPAAPWTIKVERLSLDKIGIGLEDRTAGTPLSAAIGQLKLSAGVEAQLGAAGANPGIAIHALEVGLRKIRLGSAKAVPVQIGRIDLSGGEIDLAARRFAATRLGLLDGQLKLGRDKQGKIDLLELIPGTGTATVSAAPAKVDKPWRADLAAVVLKKFTLDFTDDGSGIALQAQNIGATINKLSNDPKQSLKFAAALSLREGGKITLRGRANPALASVEANLKVEQLALKPAQPVLARYLKLKIKDGAVSANGTLSIAGAGGTAPRARYAGSVDVANFRLDEESGALFGSWKSVGAEQLSLSLQPNSLEVPDLRVVDLNAKLLIEADRSLNSSRLLVAPPPGVASVPTAPTAPADPFPVSVRRVQVQNGMLEFSDLSLRPQFSAKIHELNGTINGLSTDAAARSQVELDGRVDEFGLARIRGELNPLAPLDQTNVSLVFRNLDLVTASPYAMKFAGYKIASGKISLDLKYTVRDSRLEGQNKVVLDQLVLGERVKSPDALDLPLELALAVLTDSDGKIDLDLPISGSFDDPQFSYGAVIGKAIVNVITRIVTAPFRALGSLFGVSGDSMSSIDFDPGSAQLQPPEREKLKQVAAALSKRAQLKLSAPGSYNDTADGQALRMQSARLEIAQRAGIKIAGGEPPGPPDLQDRAVHEALRAVLIAREGVAAWDKRKVEAEAAAKASGASIGVLQRAQRLARGDPQVADLTPLYRGMLERTLQTQPLAPDALGRLAARRSDAIVSALKAAGIAAERLIQPPAQKADASTGNTIPLKLGLSSR